MTQDDRLNRPARVWQAKQPPSLKQSLNSASARKAWIRYWINDTFFGLSKLILHHFMRLLPLDACSAIGGFLGRSLARRYYPKADKRAQDNYRHLHPDWSNERIDEAVLNNWDHVGRAMAEFSTLDRLLPKGRVSVHGQEEINKAMAKGPLILMGLHTGNWEVLGPVGISLIPGLRTTYEPPDNRFEHAIAVRARTRYGIKLLPPGKAGTLPMVRLLKQGGAVVVFADDQFEKRVNAPFFGRPLHAQGNLAYIARMAARTGASVLPYWCRRESGCHFRVSIEPPVTIQAGDDENILLENIKRMNDAIEPIVLEHLDQWYWLPMYRREL